MPKPKPDPEPKRPAKPPREDANQRAHRTLEETIRISQRPWPTDITTDGDKKNASR